MDNFFLHFALFAVYYYQILVMSKTLYVVYCECEQDDILFQAHFCTKSMAEKFADLCRQKHSVDDVFIRTRKVERIESRKLEEWKNCIDWVFEEFRGGGSRLVLNDLSR